MRYENCSYYLERRCYIGIDRSLIVNCRGNFAVVGRQKSLVSSALIGPNSLFCFTLIACNFEICAAHRRSLLLQQAAAHAARTAVHESCDAVRSRKAQCPAPPASPASTCSSRVICILPHLERPFCFIFLIFFIVLTFWLAC